MNLNRVLSCLLAVVLWHTAAFGQSLGELVRREKARKATQPKAGRVYTTEDLSRSAPAPAATPEKGTTAAAEKPAEFLAPFVPSPEYIVEKMLRFAEITSEDTVYDLGSGDGRIPIMAAQKFGAKGVGVELNAELYKPAAARVKDLGLEDRVKMIHGDMLKVDLAPATIVTLYLLSSANARLRPIMEKDLQQGARVVTHDFEVPGWQPEKVQTIEDETQPTIAHKLYLYRR